MCQECEEDFHLLSVVLDIADVVEEECVVFGPALEELGQTQLAFGDEEFLHQEVAGDKQDASSLVD